MAAATIINSIAPSTFLSSSPVTVDVIDVTGSVMLSDYLQKKGFHLGKSSWGNALMSGIVFVSTRYLAKTYGPANAAANSSGS